MLREDYEKFLQVCDKYLDKEKYYLQTMRTHKNFALTFAKIRLKGTLFLESMTYKTSNNNEIFIDIIPYDNAPEGSIKRFVHSKSIYIKKHLLWSKVGYDPNPDSYFKKSLYVISNFLSKFCSRNKLKKSLEKALMKYNGNVSEYVFSNGAYPYNKETLKREWVTDLVLYRFENEAFLGAKDYKGVLEHLYGDYMKIPDESDRNTHGVIKVDFGKY
jgi:lipopolysaccharide cholinephosphotransferase